MREFQVNLFFRKILKGQAIDVSSTRSAMMDIAIAVERNSWQEDFPTILLFRHLVSHDELTQKSKTRVFTELAGLPQFQNNLLIQYGGNKVKDLISLPSYWDEVSRLCDLLGIGLFKALGLEHRKYFLDRVALSLVSSKISIEKAVTVCGVLDINRARSFLKVQNLMHVPYSLEISAVAVPHGTFQQVSYEVNADLNIFRAIGAGGHDMIYHNIWKTDIVSGFTN